MSSNAVIDPPLVAMRPVWTRQPVHDALFPVVSARFPAGGRLPMKKSAWFLETRPQFLLLAVLLVLHAAALAFWKTGAIDLVRFGLCLVGLVLLHASVNVLNDWHDWEKTGIDKETPRTPFSGGSGLLPAGVMTGKAALGLGIGTLVAGCAIGFYLVWDTWRAYGTPWPLLIIGVIGAFSIVAYTPLLTKLGVGEIFAGLGLGLLPIVGVYYVLTGRLDIAAWVSGVPPFFLTYNLLLINEFPDVEADAKGGRRHMVVLLGKKGARWIYAAAEIATYIAIVAGVVAGVLTPWALLGLGAAFFAYQAIRGAMTGYDSMETIVPAMGANVFSCLGTNALLAVGYLIAGLVK
jgi:1,4-dihydroxy-2-naphthoate octaprenyltransferase